MSMVTTLITDEAATTKADIRKYEMNWRPEGGVFFVLEIATDTSMTGKDFTTDQMRHLSESHSVQIHLTLAQLDSLVHAITTAHAVITEPDAVRA